MFDLRDVADLDRAKAASAASQFRLQILDDPDSAAFDQAYRMLDEFFGPRGELEDRGALARFARDGCIPYGQRVEGNYRMVAAWDGDTLAGVRDCYVDIDPKAGVCLTALSHALIAPEYRRSGLGAMFRAFPVTLARRITEERLGPHHGLPILIAAEMEPADPENVDTIVRLVAYGRSGFRVMDPRRVPYSQPDFRDLAAIGATHTALPLLPVVRWVDHADATAVPAWMAAAYPRLFHMAHYLYLPFDRVQPSEMHALETLSRSTEEVALLPLPTGFDQVSLLAPLLRGEVLPLYPEPLRGPEPTFNPPAEDLARLLERWP